MLSYRSFVTFLVENRIEFLKKNHPTIDSSHDHLAQHRDASAIIDHFADNADPTQNKTHTNWILNRYKKAEIRQEDAPRIKSALEKFEQNKPRLQEKDINKYPSLHHLENAVAQFDTPVKSARQERKEVKQEGVDLVHSGNGVNVYHLKTPEAARYYASGTKWCTSDHNMFNQYNKGGPILMINHKNRKYQFHNATNQFMDEQDRPVSLEHLHPDIQDELFKSTHPELKKLIAQKGNSGHIKRLIDEGNLNEKDHREIIDNIALEADQPTRQHLRRRFSFPNPAVSEKLDKHDHFDDVLEGRKKLKGDDEEEEHENFNYIVNDIQDYGNVHHASKLLHKHNNGWSLDRRTIERLGNKIVREGSHEHISKLLDRDDLTRNLKNTDSYNDIGHDMYYRGNDEIRNKLMEKPHIFNYTSNRTNQNAIAHIGSEDHVKKLLDNSSYLDYNAASHVVKRNLPGVNSRFIDDRDLFEKISSREDEYGYAPGGKKEFYGKLIEHSGDEEHKKLIENPEHLDEMGKDNRNELMVRASKPNRDLFVNKLQDKPFFNEKDIYEPNKLRTAAKYSDALESPKISKMDADGIITNNHPEHVRKLIENHFDSLDDEQKIRLHDNTNPYGRFGNPEHEKNHDAILNKIVKQKNISDELKDQIIATGNPSHIEKLTRNHPLDEKQQNESLLSINAFKINRQSEGEDQSGEHYAKTHNKIVQNVLNKKNHTEGFLTRALRYGNQETAHIISKLPPDQLTHEHKLRIAVNSRNLGHPLDAKPVDNLLNNGHELDDKTKAEIAKTGTNEQRSKLLETPGFGPSTAFELSMRHPNLITKKLNSPNLNSDAMHSIATYGNHEHRSALLKMPNIDNSTKMAIAQHGNDEHRDELLKDKDLHHFIKRKIAAHGNNQHRMELLKNHELDEETLHTIAAHGDENVHAEMLKKPNLTDRAKNYIANYVPTGENARKIANENRTKLLNDHSVSDEALRTISNHGTAEHHAFILANKRRQLNTDIMENIARGEKNKNNSKMSNENRSSILKNHTDFLNPRVTSLLANYGTDEHRSQLLDLPDIKNHKETIDIISAGGNKRSQTDLAHANRSRLLASDGKGLTLSYNAKEAIASHGTDEHRDILSRTASGMSPSSIADSKRRGENERISLSKND